MRLLATADLHSNHPRSRELAERFIAEINQQQFDVLLVIGDSAPADGDVLERCLNSFTFTGPRLFVCGNHELWTKENDSHRLFSELLPRRVRDCGWHWLEGSPLVIGEIAFVGTVGWYDYSFAPDSLAIPARFYEAKVSPGAAVRLHEFEHLIGPDVSEQQLEIVARWNDGRYVKLLRGDKQFLDELLEGLRRSLEETRPAKQVIAAIHHVPFAEMLPPRHSATWDFARAYLGSDAIGRVLMQDPRVSHVLCGHSHLAMEKQIGHIRAINIGSGYRQKRSVLLDL